MDQQFELGILPRPKKRDQSLKTSTLPEWRALIPTAGHGSTAPRWRDGNGGGGSPVISARDHEPARYLPALRGSSAGLKKVVPVGPIAVHSAMASTSFVPAKCI
jgi:hypothetical protein